MSQSNVGGSVSSVSVSEAARIAKAQAKQARKAERGTAAELAVAAKVAFAVRPCKGGCGQRFVPPMPPLAQRTVGEYTLLAGADRCPACVAKKAVARRAEEARDAAKARVEAEVALRAKGLADAVEVKAESFALRGREVLNLDGPRQARKVEAPKAPLAPASKPLAAVALAPKPAPEPVRPAKLAALGHAVTGLDVLRDAVARTAALKLERAAAAAQLEADRKAAVEQAARQQWAADLAARAAAAEARAEAERSARARHEANLAQLADELGVKLEGNRPELEALLGEQCQAVAAE